MRNEALAKAITGIDDELIAAANTTKFKNRKWRGILSVAACFVLVVCTVLFVQQKNGIEVFLYGNTISQNPVAIDSPDMASSQVRYSSQKIITIPLEIKLDKKSSLEAGEGTIEVYCAKTNELLSSGNACEAEGSVIVEWKVENLKTDETYFLKIDSDAVVLMLSYDTDIENWTLKKQ